MTPTLSVEAVQVRSTRVLEAALAVNPAGAVGGCVSAPIVVGSLAVSFAVLLSPPPDTDATLLTLAAAVSDTSTVTVHSVKLDGWSFSMPEDDFVLEQVTFRALWISVEDAGS